MHFLLFYETIDDYIQQRAANREEHLTHEEEVKRAEN